MALEDWLPMGLEQHLEAAALQNPFKRRLRLFKPDSIGQGSVKPSLSLRDLRSVSTAAFGWYYGFNLTIGGLELGAGIGYFNSTPAMAAATVDGQRQHTVLIGYDGKGRLGYGRHLWGLQPGDCLILSASSSAQNSEQKSGDRFAWIAGLCSVVFFRLDPQRLLQTVAVMGGGPTASLHEKLPLFGCDCWPLPADPTQILLQGMLRELIVKVDQLLDLNPILPERLQLDDQIYRLLAAMLVPELCQEGPYNRLRQRERQGRDAFDELIDYIKANLDHPLNLTLLEARSHYSRRTLQYAFRERLGCTATQWIRGQRLDLARQLLEHPRDGDSVASIAMASGYRSLSLFSVDFQQRFHLKPSDLLREARASSRPPAG